MSTCTTPISVLTFHFLKVYQRLFVIDFQVQYLDKKSLAGLGHWLQRRWSHCQEKKTTAEHGLAMSGIDREILQLEWEAQVSAQTKPAPRNYFHQDSLKFF